MEPDVRSGHPRFEFLWRTETYFAARAASIAWVSSGESGSYFGIKALMILPSELIRNLLKFHLMSRDRVILSRRESHKAGGDSGR